LCRSPEYQIDLESVPHNEVAFASLHINVGIVEVIPGGIRTADAELEPVRALPVLVAATVTANRTVMKIPLSWDMRTGAIMSDYDVRSS
jgi:hypothetical protein